MSGVDRVNAILDRLGGNAVLLPIPVGTKVPPMVGWTEFGPEVMADAEYLSKFDNGCNIGVCLGTQSFGLCSIDIDDDRFVEDFLQANPVLRGTLRTKRLKGCNFWIWVEGEYPGVIPLKHSRLKHWVDRNGRKKEENLPVGEWRGTGGQTVIQGQAGGIPYRFEVEAKPIRIHFSEIKWPDWILNPPFLEEDPDPKKAVYQNGSSLDKSKLENIIEYSSGVVKAACPACREMGEDNTGNHLQIKADGRFGCAKYPRDREHRKSIFRLAGVPKPQRDYPEWVDRYFGEESEKPVEPLSILTFDEIELIPYDPLDLILGESLMKKGAPLVLAGQGGVGKSRLLFQFIAACKMGLEKFLAWDIHQGARALKWLVFQTENMAQRLKSERSRLHRIMSNDQWSEFNSSVRVLCPLTEHDTMLSVDNPEAVKRMKIALDSFQPDVVACDPLGDFSDDDLSKDVIMRHTITSLSRIVKHGNPKRSLVISHHSLTGLAGHQKAIGRDRSSFARNSKVLFNWTRAQINIAPINEDNNDSLSISCGKCSDGKEFIPFAIRLNPDSMLYECDPSVDVKEWAENLKTGKNPDCIMPPYQVRQLCDVSGSSKTDLAKAIDQDAGCGRTNAYRYIRKAESDKQIKWSDDLKKFFRG